MQRAIWPLWAIAVVAGLVAGGCSRPFAHPGGPRFLTLKEGAQNPDVVWVLRKVEAPRLDTGTYETLYALFACYRSPVQRPGAPRCYLARHSWSRTDLAWPGNIAINEEGFLIEMPSSPGRRR